MAAYILKRLGLALLVALAVSIIAFGLLRLSGDPAIALAGEGASSEDIELVRKTYGFDRPLPVQYVDWLGRTLRGDLGESICFKTAAGPLIVSKLGTTLILGIASLAFALLISIPLGVMAAIWRNSLIDRLCLATAVIGQALPNFFFALLLIMLFAIGLRWLPVSGSGTWLHFVMPTIALGYYIAPAFMRLIRAGMIEVLESDYIRTARAKGIAESAVLIRHALANAAVPIVTVIGIGVALLIGGVVVTETVYAIPGLGSLTVDAVLNRDFPVIQGLVLFFSLSYVLINLLVDLSYLFLDPRIRY